MHLVSAEQALNISRHFSFWKASMQLYFVSMMKQCANASRMPPISS